MISRIEIGLTKSINDLSENFGKNLRKKERMKCFE